MSTELAMPDAVADIEAMTLAEVQRDLSAYRPGDRAEVLAVEAWLARRRALWRQLDRLVKSGGATPSQRGAQA